MTEDTRDGARGMLADVDRAWITGEKQYDHRQQRYDRRQKIRERVRNTMLDFELLADMDRNERQRVLNFDEHPDFRYDIGWSLPWMFSFAHKIVLDMYGDLEPHHDPYGHKSAQFQVALRRGLERAYREENLVLKDLALEVESEEVPGISEIRERIANGEPVDTQTIQYLVNEDEIDTTEYFEFLAEQLGVEPPQFDGTDEE